MLKEALKPFSQKISVWFLILIGTLSWSLTMIKSGWVYPYGMGFWGANGHDGIWHIALSESLKRGSFSMPVFSGFLLHNYHIGFDLFLAFISKITTISVVNVYFQLLPPLFAFLIGYLTYLFVFRWTKSEKSAFWSTFFVYFGGSFGYIIGKGESAFWSQQAISTLINPPFALSLIFILLGLVNLQSYTQKAKIINLILSIIFFGLLIEIKIYAGLLVLFGLFCATLQYSFKNRSDQTMLILVRSTKVFVGSLIISILLFITFNNGSASLIVFRPFWFLETMMALTDRVGWLKFYLAMTSYKSGHIWLKEIPAYTVAFVIFWVGNMGTRIVKEVFVWKWVKNFKDIGWAEVFVFSIIIAGGVIPMFFLQKGTPWNTIQFFYYSLFFSAILAGITVGKFVESFKLKAVMRNIVVAITVLLTIPTTFLTLKDVYIPSRPPAMLSNDELSALNFLKRQPDGVVLTFPFDQLAAKSAESNPPRPLYLYDSTAYVSAFSGHSTFLEDEVNLDITGYDWAGRLEEVQAWYKESNEVNAREFLKSKNIKYIYWLKGQRAVLGETQLGIEKIFENKEVDVFVVKS